MKKKEIKEKVKQCSVLYSYLRDSRNRPTTTICFISDGNVWAAGLAYCHPDDNPCRKTGRRLSYGRALGAFFQPTPPASSAYQLHMNTEARPDPFFTRLFKLARNRTAPIGG